MASEIRANSITSRAGLSTVTMTDSGPMFSGITTFVDNSGFTFGVGGGTSIFTPATNVLTFGTNNTEKIRIDASGHMHGVGVITATHFYGNGANLTSLPAQVTISNNADNRVITGGSGVNLNGESGLLFDGTQLQVGGDSGFSGTWGLEVYNTSSNEGTALIGGLQGAQLQIRDLGSSECIKLAANGQASIQSLKAGDPMVFFTTPSGGSVTERLRIASDGKIGIGHHTATQINSELTIRPANDGGILIGRPGDTVAPINKALTITTTTTGSEAYHTKYHTYNCNSIFATYEGGGTGGNIIFKTGSGSGNETERLRLTSAGNLVIGHTSGNNKLQIGNTGHSGYCIAANSPSYGAVIQVGDGATPGTAAALWIRNLNNGGGTTACFRVQGDGTTHFGDQTSVGKYNDGGSGASWYDAKDSWQQGQQASVGWSMMYFNKIGSGDNRIMQFNSSGSNIGYINRSGSNVAFLTSSDYRLKKDVVALPNGIERVKQLRPVAFKWIQDDSDMEGFLAHEAQEICPYAVSGTKDEVALEDHGDRKKGDMINQCVDYGEFTPLLTAAMKELITKVETLEQDNIALRARVTNLEGN